MNDLNLIINIILELFFIFLFIFFFWFLLKKIFSNFIFLIGFIFFFFGLIFYLFINLLIYLSAIINNPFFIINVFLDSDFFSLDYFFNNSFDFINNLNNKSLLQNSSSFFCSPIKKVFSYFVNIFSPSDPNAAFRDPSRSSVFVVTDDGVEYKEEEQKCSKELKDIAKKKREEKLNSMFKEEFIKEDVRGEGAILSDYGVEDKESFQVTAVYTFIVDEDKSESASSSEEDFLSDWIEEANNTDILSILKECDTVEPTSITISDNDFAALVMREIENSTNNSTESSTTTSSTNTILNSADYYNLDEDEDMSEEEEQERINREAYRRRCRERERQEEEGEEEEYPYLDEEYD